MRARLVRLEDLPTHSRALHFLQMQVARIRGSRRFVGQVQIQQAPLHWEMCKGLTHLQVKSLDSLGVNVFGIDFSLATGTKNVHLFFF